MRGSPRADERTIQPGECRAAAQTPTAASLLCCITTVGLSDTNSHVPFVLCIKCRPLRHRKMRAPRPARSSGPSPDGGHACLNPRGSHQDHDPTRGQQRALPALPSTQSPSTWPFPWSIPSASASAPPLPAEDGGAPRGDSAAA